MRADRGVRLRVRDSKEAQAEAERTRLGGPPRSTVSINFSEDDMLFFDAKTELRIN